MMRRTVIFMLFIAALAGSAQAILPPDAKAREPQLRAYRQQLTDNYEKKQAERRAAAVRAYEQTRADIFTPPWMRAGTTAVILFEADQSAALKAAKAQKRNHRFLVSVMFLILIGAAAGWVRHTTRELDG
jgi:hypothetical protein